MEQETWKDVLGFEGSYMVSNLGRVKSLDRTVIYGGKRVGQRIHKGTILKPALVMGYPSVGLKRGPLKKTLCVHSLVMAAFCGPRPEGFEVAHNDGIRTNARLENLRYDTRKGNHADKKRHGTWQGGENNPQHKLTSAQVQAIYRLAWSGWTQKKIADLFNVDPSTVGHIKRGEQWASVTGARKENE